MPQHKHQGWAEPFNDDRTEAEGRRQQAITDAQAAHEVAADKLRNKHAAEAREPDPDAQYHRQVRELKAQGVPPTQIAQQLKIGRASVYRVLADKPAAA